MRYCVRVNPAFNWFSLQQWVFNTSLQKIASVTPTAAVKQSAKVLGPLVLHSRQKTYMDGQCGTMDDTGKGPLGSRVWGDCDLLMRNVMKCILSQDALQQWEGDHSKRQRLYDSKRTKDCWLFIYSYLLITDGNYVAFDGYILFTWQELLCRFGGT